MTTCPNCKKQYTPTLLLQRTINSKGIADWESGMSVQQAFPNAGAMLREQLITGLCSEACWDEFLGVKPRRKR